MSQILERLNVKSYQFKYPFLLRDICGSVDHLTVYCQMGSPFAQDISDQVNYVNNYEPRLANDPFSSTQNPRWKNHPNFSYSSNAPLVSQTNFRPPLWILKDQPILSKHLKNPT